MTDSIMNCEPAKATKPEGLLALAGKAAEKAEVTANHAESVASTLAGDIPTEATGDSADHGQGFYADLWRHIDRILESLDRIGASLNRME